MVDNIHFRSFSAKYVSEFPLPTSHTLYKTYIQKTYQRAIGNIKEDIRNKFLWLTVDETTDFCGNKVVNILIQIYSVSDISPPILIANKRLLQTPAKGIEIVVTRVLSSVYVKNNNALMYPNLIHVTCLAHALHRAAEEGRKQYPLVDSLIGSTKEIVIKASSRKQNFKQQFSHTLPPRPVTTRWCTWVYAAVYFAKYFEIVKTTKLVIHVPRNKVTTNFEILTLATTELETSILGVSDTFSLIDGVQTRLDTLTHTESVAVNNELKTV
ncbi:hypothetical protein NQ318_013655 [Aromia moschata]|uniref:DUF659 domain-containing protein n=1 Tax=Aromia moschata TaxID=1265417 RepID=A0AAV8Y2K3_9CUCU|nr:hypothetical protein NQ318_013655 [Aromia moschata]